MVTEAQPYSLGKRFLLKVPLKGNWEATTGQVGSTEAGVRKLQLHTQKIPRALQIPIIAGLFSQPCALSHRSNRWRRS